MCDCGMVSVLEGRGGSRQPLSLAQTTAGWGPGACSGTAYHAPATGSLLSGLGCGQCAPSPLPPPSPLCLRGWAGAESVQRGWGDSAPSSPLPNEGLPSEESEKHCLA